MNDRLDLKLLLLRMIKGFYKPLIGALIGALLIGIPYTIVNVILAEDPDYRMRVTYHVEYSEDSAGNSLDYINEFTWGEWVDTDVFMDALSQRLGGNYDKEFLRQAVNATLETDARLPEIDVTTKDPSLTQEIAEAVAKINSVLDEHILEIKSSEVVFIDEYAKEVDQDIRVLNAFILGAVLGFVFTLFGMLILYIIDDSIYVPLQFKERYSFAMEVEGEESTKSEGTEIYIGRELKEFPERFTDNKAVLKIEAGAHNFKLLEAVIYELEDNGVEITKAILMKPDKRLIKAYMASTKLPNPFVKE